MEGGSVDNAVTVIIVITVSTQYTVLQYKTIRKCRHFIRIIWGRKISFVSDVRNIVLLKIERGCGKRLRVVFDETLFLSVTIGVPQEFI